jgi:hypothetical protein
MKTTKLRMRIQSQLAGLQIAKPNYYWSFQSIRSYWPFLGGHPVDGIPNGNKL